MHSLHLWSACCVCTTLLCLQQALPVSSLHYPSRTKLPMENWTPLQFLALCWLNKPFHLLFIPLALLAQTSPCYAEMPSVGASYTGVTGYIWGEFLCFMPCKYYTTDFKKVELIQNSLMEMFYASKNNFSVQYLSNIKNDLLCSDRLMPVLETSPTVPYTPQG